MDGIRIWIHYTKNKYVTNITGENYVTSLLEGFTPSGLRIKKRTPFKAVSDTFEGEWNSILYDTEKRLVELLLKESQEAVSVVEAEIQVEIERSDSTNEILEDLEKKHKEYKEQLEKRRKKKWSQMRFREANTASSYKHDFKHQERRNSVIKLTDLGVELNEEKTASVHNARENKGKEVIGRNVESKSGKEFIKIKSIENVLCCNKIPDNRKLTKGRNKAYADVVSVGLDLSTEEVDFETQNNDELNFVKRMTEKKVYILLLFLLTSLRRKCLLSTQPPLLSFAMTLSLLRTPRTVLISK